MNSNNSKRAVIEFQGEQELVLESCTSRATVPVICSGKWEVAILSYNPETGLCTVDFLDGYLARDLHPTVYVIQMIQTDTPTDQ